MPYARRLFAALFTAQRANRVALVAQVCIDGEDFAGHRIDAWFTRMDPASFPLVERGFNWVQEHP